MRKKEYEKPVVETVEFEIPENIMSDTGDLGGGDMSGSDEIVDW